MPSIFEIYKIALFCVLLVAGFMIVTFLPAALAGLWLDTGTRTGWLRRVKVACMVLSVLWGTMTVFAVMVYLQAHDEHCTPDDGFVTYEENC